MSLRNTFVSRVIEAGGRLKVRSALNPVLWLCAIVSIPSLLFFTLMSSPPEWLIWMTFSPVITAIFGFLFLLFFDRDKLQSEEYQLKKRSLEMVEQKGDIQAVPADTLEIIENPDIKEITKD